MFLYLLFNSLHLPLYINTCENNPYSSHILNFILQMTNTPLPHQLAELGQQMFYHYLWTEGCDDQISDNDSKCQ